MEKRCKAFLLALMLLVCQVCTSGVMAADQTVSYKLTLVSVGSSSAPAVEVRLAVSGGAAAAEVSSFEFSLDYGSELELTSLQKTSAVPNSQFYTAADNKLMWATLEEGFEVGKTPVTIARAAFDAAGAQSGAAAVRVKDCHVVTGDEQAYSPVTTAGCEVAVGKEAQATLSINTVALFVGTPATLTTTGGSGAVTYAVKNGTGSAAISGAVLTPTKAGTVTVTATKAGDANYTATSASAIFTVQEASADTSGYTFTVLADGKARATALVGDTVAVTLRLACDGKNAYDLYSFENYISYDPAYLEIVDGSIAVTKLSNTSSQINAILQKQLHRVFVSRLSMDGSAAGVSADTVLISFQVKTLKAGVASLSQANSAVYDARFASKPVSAPGASVDVKKSDGDPTVDPKDPTVDPEDPTVDPETPADPRRPGRPVSPNPNPTPDPTPDPVDTDVTGFSRTPGNRRGGTSSTVAGEQPLEEEELVAAVQTGGAVTATVIPTETVAGTGSYAYTMTAELGKELADEAAGINPKELVLEASVPVTANAVTIRLPAATAKSLAAASNASVTVISPVGSVTVGGKALSELAGSGDVGLGVTSIAGMQTAIVGVTAGGRDVQSVTGGVRASLPRLSSAAGDAALVDSGAGQAIKFSAVTPTGAKALLDGSAVVEVREGMGKTFPDVAGRWMESGVRSVTARGVMKGGDDGSFAPDRTMTRAQLAQTFHNLADAPSVQSAAAFADVESYRWYADAAAWAKQAGVMTGEEGGAFHADGAVTREAVAQMLYNYARYLGLNVSGRASLDAFADRSDVGGWAEVPMKWAVSAKLFEGSVNEETGEWTLDPKGELTRAAMAKLITSFVELVLE